MSNDNPTMNIYCISYNRSDTTIVHKLLEYVTFIVRKSQEKDYQLLGSDVFAIDDELVSSFAKVNNWILENINVDVAAVLDDDIDNFIYLNTGNRSISKNIEESTREIERLCQILYDLDIALLGTPITPIPYKYLGPYSFSGMIGPLRIYNIKRIKTRYKDIKFFGDTDFVLTELLNNRIILRPNYFVPSAKLEKNKGGMNIVRNKEMQDELAVYMSQKWGKYFLFKDSGFYKNTTKILVNR
jgi:hypothetical protein